MADGHRKHRCFSASSGMGEADRFMELFFLTMPASFRTLQSDFESRLKAGTLGTRKAADFTSGFQFANAFILVRWPAQNDSMAPSNDSNRDPEASVASAGYGFEQIESFMEAGLPRSGNTLEAT